MECSPAPSRSLEKDFPICIDGRMIGAGTSGVTRYAETLYTSLRSAGLEPGLLDDGGAHLRRGSWRNLLAAARPSSRRLTAMPRGFSGRDIFREAQIHFNLYGRLLSLKPPQPFGLMHWTYPVPLHLNGWKNIYTIHDAIPLLHPELSSIEPRRHARLLRRVMAACDLILTVSESARRDIASTTGYPMERIANVSQAVEAEETTISPSAVPETLSNTPYFIVIGAIEARKNSARLIEAYSKSGTGVPLLFVGGIGWRGQEAASGLPRRRNIYHLPPQPRQSLVALLANAKALLFPSLAEGFGLPIAEAMALGVPVMTSKGGATEETAGGAAFLVDPLDVSAIAQAIVRLDTDEVLRAKLRALGLKRATAFRAELYVQRLVDQYIKVVNG